MIRERHAQKKPEGHDPEHEDEHRESRMLGHEFVDELLREHLFGLAQSATDVTDAAMAEEVITEEDVERTCGSAPVYG